MAKTKKESQTYVVNLLGEIIGYLSLAIITYADDLKGAVPEEVYIALIIASFTYNRWRRTKTSEPIVSSEEPSNADNRGTT